MRKREVRRKYLVTGGSGLIGSYFLKNSQELPPDIQVFSPKHSELDISDMDALESYVKLYQPDTIINFAAFRNATLAEAERGNKKGGVWKTNVLGSLNIAKVSKKHRIYLVHISSEYVFSGHKRRPGPYSEDDPAEENDELLSWYGITKKEAEKIVRNILDTSAIIRIGNVTQPGEISNLDYVGKILWLYQQEKLYPLFRDQYITLTYIPTITKVIYKLSEKKLNGIYHIASKDLITPYKLASFLIKQTKNSKKELTSKKVTLKSTGINKFLEINPRRYPKFGGLKVEKTQKKLKMTFDSWKEIVEKFLEY